MMNVQKNNAGFCLLELIIAVTVMVVLAAFSSVAAVRLYQSALDRTYAIEAANVYKAAELYMLDENENAEPMELVYRITRYLLDEQRNVLRPYLKGTITEGAFIQWMILDRYTGALLEIEYCAAGYVIDVERNGKTTILKRPGSDKRR